jgi:hypothetical protein
MKFLKRGQEKKLFKSYYIEKDGYILEVFYLPLRVNRIYKNKYLLGIV